MGILASKLFISRSKVVNLGQICVFNACSIRVQLVFNSGPCCSISVQSDIGDVQSPECCGNHRHYPGNACVSGG